MTLLYWTHAPCTLLYSLPTLHSTSVGLQLHSRAYHTPGFVPDPLL